MKSAARPLVGMRESSRHVRPLERVYCRTPRRWPSLCGGDSPWLRHTGFDESPLLGPISVLCSLTPCQSDYVRNRSTIRVRSGSERLFRYSPGAPLGDFIGSRSVAKAACPACTCQPWWAVQGGAGTGERSRREESLFCTVETFRFAQSYAQGDRHGGRAGFFNTLSNSRLDFRGKVC